MSEEMPPGLPVDDVAEAIPEVTPEIITEAIPMEPDAPAAEDVSSAADEQMLRLQADFDNYRRRTRAELADAQAQAEVRVLMEMLPVLDNLHLAIAAAAEGDGLVNGVTMVAAQLEALLAQRGVEPIAALGAPFDPTLHEAVGSHADPTVAPHTVVHVAQAGYRRGDTVLRAARVIVSAP